MDLIELKKFLQKHNQPKFRLEQIQKAVFQDGVFSFSEITTLSKDLREKMEQEIKVLSFKVEKVLEAKDKQSIKALLKLNDGKLIETVLISPMPDTWSACISCQVGCPMGCQFCATGKLGLKRNLTAEEITDQVLFWKQHLKRLHGSTKDTRCPADRASERHQVSKVGDQKLQTTNHKLDTIVFMGMGEPFANWENVRESLQNLIDPKIFGFGARSISVSTSGLPEGIAKLAAEFPQVNLAISLHFAEDAKRSQFMPVNKKYDLEKLRKSLRNYFEKTNRKVFIEYILLDKINDSRADADKLARYLKSIGKLQLLHVNLIRYNTTGAELKPSARERAQAFKNYLLQNHIQATIRKSLGEEIQGACGQLSSEK